MYTDAPNFMEIFTPLIPSLSKLLGLDKRLENTQ